MSTEDKDKDFNEGFKFTIGGKEIHGIVPMVYDEQFELVKQMENNHQKLVFGIGDYPVGITGDTDDLLGRIGLKERILEITFDKYIQCLQKLEAINKLKESPK